MGVGVAEVAAMAGVQEFMEALGTMILILTDTAMDTPLGDMVMGMVLMPMSPLAAHLG